jgi:glycosyltransferase involved in cell wall biosynthesis
LRILHIIPHYYPAVRYGGPIRSVHGLAAGCAALGNDVHVYTTNVDGNGVSDVLTCTPVERDGVKVWYFPASLGRRVFRSAAMDRALNAAIATFDIAHIHYMWVWPTVAAAAAARKHHTPYVLAPRGMLVKDLIRRKNMLAKRVWLAFFDRRNVEFAAAIHVTSESEAAELRALGLSLPRIEVIENGVEVTLAENLILEGAPIMKKASFNDSYILFLGRINWKKGLDRLIRALVLVRGADLVVAGYDENDYQSKLRRLALEVGVADRVKFIGPVDGERKWDLLRLARCLVLPSYNENFGMAAIEAMAVGCPVVVSEEVGLANIVIASGGGIVTPGHQSALARAINILVDSPEKRNAMGIAGLRTVRENYGWQRISERMLELYKQCI